MSVALQHYLLFLSWKIQFLKSLYNFLSKKKHMRRWFSRGKIDTCQIGIFLKAVDKFYSLFKMCWWIGICLMRTSHIFFHPSSYCLASFVRSPACWQFGRVALRPSVWSLHHARSSQHSTRAQQHVRPSSHTQQSVTTTLHVHTRSHAHWSHTLCFFSGHCAHFFIYFYNDLFFSFLFGINRSLCCTAFFTLDEPSKWSGDLQTTKSRNNNTEKVSHPIVFARDYRIWVRSANGRISNLSV